MKYITVLIIIAFALAGCDTKVSIADGKIDIEAGDNKLNVDRTGASIQAGNSSINISGDTELNTSQIEIDINDIDDTLNSITNVATTQLQDPIVNGMDITTDITINENTEKALVNGNNHVVTLTGEGNIELTVNGFNHTVVVEEPIKIKKLTVVGEDHKVTLPKDSVESRSISGFDNEIIYI